MIARYLTNNFAGLALMVDNTNPNTCVQVGGILYKNNLIFKTLICL